MLVTSLTLRPGISAAFSSPFGHVVHGAETIGNPVLAPVPDEQDVRLLERGGAEGALRRPIGAGRLERLAGFPVCALHRPRHHVLEPAEHRAAVAGVLRRAVPVRAVDGGAAPGAAFGCLVCHGR